MNNKERLIYQFKKASETKQGIAVAIKMPNQIEPEIIINHNKSLENKLEYYKKAYTDDLELHANKEIKIIGIANAPLDLFDDFNNAIIENRKKFIL